MSEGARGWRAGLIRPDALSPADEAGWRALQGAHRDYGSPHLGPDFARFCAGIDPAARLLLMHDAAGRLGGVLPLTLRRGRFARAIGAPFCDYSGPVLAADFDGDLRALLTLAGVSAFRMNASPDPFDHLAAFRRGGETGYRVCSRGETGEQILERMRAASAKAHKNFRRLRNRLERECPPVVLQGGAPDPATLSTLFAWKQRQYAATAKLDVIARPLGRAMLDALSQTSQGPCRGYQLALTCAGRLVAAEYGFLAAGTYHPWISAYDPAFEAYGPGNQLMRETLLQMPALGMDAYDLGIGHGEYKKYFCDTEIPVHSGLIVASGTVGAWQRLSDALIRLPERGPLRSPAAKLRRRLDHIAASETRLAARTALLVESFAQQARRGRAPAPGPAADTEESQA